MTEITHLLTYKVRRTTKKTIFGQTKVNRLKLKKNPKNPKNYFFKFFLSIF